MSEVNIKGKIEIDAAGSQKSINDLNAEIKQTKEALNNAKIGSAEYLEAQKKLIAQQSQLSTATQQGSGHFGKLKESINSSVPAMNGVTQSTGLFNQALNMLRANPIIGIITVFVLIMVKLWERFKNMEAVADSLTKAFSVFGSIVNSIIDVVLMPLIDAFVAVADAASAVGSWLTGLFSSGSKEAADRTGELTDKLDELEDAEKRNALALEETNAKLKEAREKADDANLPIEERIGYLEEAKALEKKATQESIENNKTRAMANMEMLALEVKAGDDVIAKIKEGSYESLKAAREIMANMKNIDKEKLYSNDQYLKGMQQGVADLATTEKKTNKAIESLRKEETQAKEQAAKEAQQAAKERQQKAEQDARAAEQKRKQAAQQAAQEAKARREQEYQHAITIAKQQQDIELAAITDGKAKELKVLENRYQTDLAQLKKSLEDKKVTQKQFNEVAANMLTISNQQKDAIETKYREEQKKKDADFQNEINKLNIEIRLAGITDQREKEKVALELAFDDKRKQAEDKYKDDAIKLQAIKDVIDIQQRQANKLLEDKYNEEDRVANEALTLRQIGWRLGQANVEFDEQRKLLLQKQSIIDQQYNAELAAAQNNALKKKQIEQDYLEHSNEISIAQKLIAKNEAAAKIQALDSVSSTLSNAANLFNKQSAAGKSLAIAAATISMFTAAQKAYESTVGIPIVGPVLAPINSGLAIATGIKNIKEIAKVQVPGQSSGGSVPSITPQTANAPIAPQAQTTQLNQQSINAVGNAAQGGVNRAFVLDADIQNNAQQAAAINRQARIG